MIYLFSIIAQIRHLKNYFLAAGRRQKKALETPGGLWYIEHKEGHLL